MISPKLVFDQNTLFNNSIIDAVWLIRENHEIKTNIIKDLNKTSIKYKVFNKKMVKRSLDMMNESISNHESIIDSANMASRYYSVDEVFYKKK